MHGSRIIGALLAAIASSCLLLTGWIMHRSGVLQGATEDGRWALGLAAIAVHVSLAAMGLAMFASRKWWVSLVCAVMMLGAAACSAWQIASFLATEVISVNRAREVAEQRETARQKAALELAREQQKTQAQFAKDYLGWVKGTVRNADGRRERKDSIDAGLKVVSEIGKVQAPVIPEAKTETAQLQSGVLAQWLAARLGYDEMTLQASPSLMVALMLLLIEVVFWPLSSYFWNKSPVLIEIGPAPAAPAMRVPLAPQPAVALDATEPVRALPAPVALQSADVGQGQPEPPPRPPHPSTAQPQKWPRQPVSEDAQRLLDDIGYSWRVQPTEAQPKEAPREAARRFVVWAKCYGRHGEYNPYDLYELYVTFAESERRDPVKMSPLFSALDSARGIDKTRPTTPDGKRPTIWVIGKLRPPKAQAAKTVLGDGGAGRNDTEASQNDAAAEPVREGRHNNPFCASSVVVMMRPDGHDLAWLRAQQKAMRALRIARNRKQRGSITMRARAA